MLTLAQRSYSPYHWALHFFNLGLQLQGYPLSLASLFFNYRWECGDHWKYFSTFSGGKNNNVSRVQHVWSIESLAAPSRWRSLPLLPPTTNISFSVPLWMEKRVEHPTTRIQIGKDCTFIKLEKTLFFVRLTTGWLIMWCTFWSFSWFRWRIWDWISKNPHCKTYFSENMWGDFHLTYQKLFILPKPGNWLLDWFLFGQL